MDHHGTLGHAWIIEWCEGHPLGCVDQRVIEEVLCKETPRDNMVLQSGGKGRVVGNAYLTNIRWHLERN